jgi:hypothetical protein
MTEPQEKQKQLGDEAVLRQDKLPPSGDADRFTGSIQ